MQNARNHFGHVEGFFLGQNISEGPRRYTGDLRTFLVFQAKAAELENNKTRSPEKQRLALSDIGLKDCYFLL